MKTTFHVDGGDLTVHRREDDVGPALERNKALQHTAQDVDGLHHIASIPAVIVEKWMNEEGVPFLTMPEHEFRRFIRRKLNDPDNSWLKTTARRL